MNKIYIELLKSNIQPLEFLLQEDFTIDAKSEFSSFGELLPGVFTELINLVTAGSSMGGTAGKGIVYMNNVLDLKRWTKTLPPSINCTLKFYTKESVIEDVWLPMTLFQSLGVLSRTSNGNFITPGPSLNSVGKISAVLNDQDRTTPAPKDYKRKSLKDALGGSFENPIDFTSIQSKICSIWIPGVIYIPFAFIEACVPKHSNQVVVTKDGKEYPLFGECQLTISGISSTIDDMFLDSNRISITDKAILVQDPSKYNNSASEANIKQKVDEVPIADRIGS